MNKDNYNEDKIKSFINIKGINRDTVLSYVKTDEKGKKTFNVSRFAKYILTRINLIRQEGSNEIYIYNMEGRYEPLLEWYLPTIIKQIFSYCHCNYLGKYEYQIIKAIKSDCTSTINNFNVDNAVNFKNGVFYLDEGVLRPHNPDYTMFNYTLDYSYEQSAECPVFKIFIKETFCDDEELIKLIQEIIGYSLSTDKGADKGFFFYGGGCNGKSVIANLLRYLVGEKQSCAISLEGLNGQFGTQDLIGKKLNISAENESMPNTEKLKSLISCDRTNIKRKYETDWSGELFVKHIFLMNSLPNTPDITYGFMRKIIIVPFNNTVKKEDIDRDLLKKLLNELPGIFNWAYEGYKRLKANNYNFTECKAVNDIMNDYIQRENPTGAFFTENYVSDENGKILKSGIYQSYCQWAEENGAISMSRNKFWQAFDLKFNEITGKNAKDLYVNHHGIYYLKGYRKVAQCDETIQ